MDQRKVDLDYLDKLHDLYNYYPLVPQKSLKRKVIWISITNLKKKEFSPSKNLFLIYALRKNANFITNIKSFFKGSIKILKNSWSNGIQTNQS